MFLRNPHGPWKSLNWLSPGLDFIPNIFSFFTGMGVAKERPPFDSGAAMGLACKMFRLWIHRHIVHQDD